jgi:hypothetical protein
MTPEQIDMSIASARLQVLRADVTTMVRKIGLGSLPGEMRICLDLAETHYATSLRIDRTTEQKAMLRKLANDLYEVILHNAASMLYIKP